jgi:limonene-1,2-epoxide hydrolase
MADGTAEEVVLAFFAAWARLDLDAIMSFFTPDAQWENVPIGVVSGSEAIRADVEAFLEQMSSFEVEFVNIAANGNVVLAERVDTVGVDDEQSFARVAGVFEIENGKIKLWRDYFAIPNDDE